MSASLLRVAARGPSSILRANLAAARPQPMAPRAGLAVSNLPSNSFSTSSRLRSEHQEETFEEFTAR
jgi:cytochrome c oxidase subunit 5a